MLFWPVEQCSSENNLRLYNRYDSTSTQGGMLQICRSNLWRAVCDYGWGCTNGRAACKELGYGGNKMGMWYNYQWAIIIQQN